MFNDIELLAPVGSMGSLHAAVNNGADAVYLGGKLFNARQSASNFDEEELEKAVKYAHRRGVKVYVAVNIAIKNVEIKELEGYLGFLSEIDVDAVIVQDLGVINLIKKKYPDLSIHASTQMTITNSQGVKLLQDIGVERAVLARELTLDEIADIKKGTDAELEVFVHGALCVSYSGQCLMSSMIGGRSGNRGTCAQTCRMPFEIEDDAGRRDLKPGGKYLLSPKDLNTVDDIGKLIDIGVHSFKIEGRMKKPEYVALIVNKYRKAIDNHLGKSKDAISQEDRIEMEKIFNRGFTKGFRGGDFGESFISLDKPNNRGIYLGKAIEVRNQKTKVKLEEGIVKGDGISVDNEDGSKDVFVVDKIFIDRKEARSAKKGQIVELNVFKKVKKNARLFKTYDKLLHDKIKAEYLPEIEVEDKPVDMIMEVKLGEKPRLTMVCGDVKVDVCGDDAVEKAMKSSLNEEKVKSQLGKLGDTGFRIQSIELDIEEEAFMPVSTINKLRRDAIEELNDRLYGLEKLNLSVSDYVDKKIDHVYSGTGLSVSVERLEQLEQLELDEVKRLYVPLNQDVERFVERARSAQEIFVSTEKILGDQDLELLRRRLEKVSGAISGVSAANIGTVKFIRDNFKGLKIHADSSLNVFNEESVRFLNNNEVGSLTLSPELNLEEVKELAESLDYSYECLVYGYIGLMTMRHCPMSLVKKCGSDRKCAECNFSSGYGLVDRKEMKFRMKRSNDITTIYNSQILFVPELVDEIKQSEIDYVRLDFTNELEEIRDVQELYLKALNSRVDRMDIESVVREHDLRRRITRGHFNRGII